MSEVLILPKELPVPIKEALTNQREAIAECEDRIAELKMDLVEYKAKLTVALGLGMNARSIKIRITKTKRWLDEADRQVKAFKAGSVEIPNFGWGERLEDEERWGVSLGPDVPLRVFEAVKAAKDSGVFTEVRMHRPERERGNDPIVFGIIGGRHFYITSWR